MGRIQSSIGLITGTDIVGTVDRLIALSGRPRDRLISRTNTLQQERQAIAELTASVIGVQLAGNQLANLSTFRSKTAESSDSGSLSAVVGNDAAPGSHIIRTLRSAATHDIHSLQRLDATDQALGYSGTLRISPNGGFIDGSATLSGLNGGRGVEPGRIRITDRSGVSSDIDLTEARNINDVIDAINDARIDVRATTLGNAIQLIDESGGADSNLQVEQLGSEETAADLGLWGIDTASNIATGIELDLPSGVGALLGTALSELNGGSGIGPLTDLEITLSDGSSATIDLSNATTTGEIINAIETAKLSLIVRLNDARNGFQIRDVSGGTGKLNISSGDTTAADLGIAALTTDEIVVGSNLNRQSVTTDTLLADLNQGSGTDTGSFTVTDSDGAVGAVNLAVEGITTVGELIDAVNMMGIGVTAALSDAGDGITVVDQASGASALTITDTGNGTTAADLGIAGTATKRTVKNSIVSALVGTQADIVTVQADDTLDTLVAKINSQGRYAEASVRLSDDGTYSLRIKSTSGGEAGRIAINTTGFELDFRTANRGTDALIAVSTDGGIERFRTSSDGVFDLGISGEATTQTMDDPSVSELVGPVETDTTSGTTGLVLTLKQLSESPITVTVNEDPGAVIAAATTFVNQYNLLIDKLDSVTFFNADTDEVGLLFGSSEAQRIRNGYSRLLSGRINSAGDFKSIGQIGLRFNDQGKLDLDSSKLSEALESNRGDVEEFFTTDETGLANRLSSLADRIAGESNGLLINRSQTLTTQVEFNNTRINSFNARLEKERERLLLRFYSTEEAIAKLLANQSAINQIRPITIPT